jgi:hypothetical protein
MEARTREATDELEAEEGAVPAETRIISPRPRNDKCSPEVGVWIRAQKNAGGMRVSNDAE